MEANNVTDTVVGATRYDADRQWMLAQGMIARNLAEYPVAERPKRGSLAAAFDELSGNTTLGAHMSQLRPGAHNFGHRHVDEAVFFIVSGRGWSELKQSDEKDVQRVDWQAGSLVAIPSNAWHQHFNADADNPARMLAFKNTRLLRRLFGSREFVYESNARLHNRYDDEPDYWTRRVTEDDGRIAVNRIEDVNAEVLVERPDAGRGVSAQQYRIGGNYTLDTVIAEVVRRGHIRAHRKLAEEAVFVLGGRGRSIFWNDQGREHVVKWRAGDLFSPPLGVWQQHLTEGHDPARLLLVRDNFLSQALGVGHGLLGSDVPDRLPLVAEPAAADSPTPAQIHIEP
jgi:quercetin dioxygenase-like cupin family protein